MNMVGLLLLEVNDVFKSAHEPMKRFSCFALNKLSTSNKFKIRVAKKWIHIGHFLSFPFFSALLERAGGINEKLKKDKNDIQQSHKHTNNTLNFELTRHTYTYSTHLSRLRRR
jgi:hypothetical protein